MTKTLFCALFMGAGIAVAGSTPASAAPLAPSGVWLDRPEVATVQFRPGDRRGPARHRLHPGPMPRPMPRPMVILPRERERTIHRTVQIRPVRPHRAPLCRCR
ncbi:hypothetical protein [Chelatococcus sp. YT9]|uniref:hypothetical protein n=1 Tax=Chelatococcus sp. YT9 TaxID=2835635 RepID=UPI001BD0F88A|nr:hypothetical protein [Chelatococcus sp. YT9]MBS7698286.1 hypothetical protein [Chelatococcus sp. YT9]